MTVSGIDSTIRMFNGIPGFIKETRKDYIRTFGRNLRQRYRVPRDTGDLSKSIRINVKKEPMSVSLGVGTVRTLGDSKYGMPFNYAAAIEFGTFSPRHVPKETVSKRSGWKPALDLTYIEPKAGRHNIPKALAFADSRFKSISFKNFKRFVKGK